MLAASLATAAALAVMLYLATTTLPYLATSPTTAPSLGELTQCLPAAIAEARGGFAVAADGRAAATFGGKAFVVCEAAASSDGGRPQARARVFPVEGVATAAFDFEGALWFATGRRGEAAPALWRIAPGGEPERVGE